MLRLPPTYHNTHPLITTCRNLPSDIYPLINPVEYLDELNAQVTPHLS